VRHKQLLVLSRLDYSNATLAAISSHLLSRLQSVMNAAGWLIVSSSKFQHVTQSPLLRQLHWLKAPERIAFKYAVLCSSVSTDLHLHTLSTSFVRWQMSGLVSDLFPVHPHHWLSAATDCLTSVPSFSGRRCSHLEESAWSCHFCTFR